MVPSLIDSFTIFFLFVIRGDSMQFKPKLNEYNINALSVLANNSSDEFTINKIKMIIIEKILNYNYSMFYLMHKFKLSNGILKEAYADVILMNMKDNDYYINDGIVDEILKYASFEALVNYGTNSDSLEFSMKCKEEYDTRYKIIEDKIEFFRKSMEEGNERKILLKKKKGDRK